MADLIQINLCRGFRITSQVDLQPPLGESFSAPEGIASLGCFPVLSHHKVEGTNAVYSRINRETGAIDRTLFTIGEDDDNVEINYPSHSAMVAARRGVPFSGPATSPYPLPFPSLNKEVTYRMNGDLVNFDWSEGAPPDPNVTGGDPHFNQNGRLYLVDYGDGVFVDSAPVAGALTLKPYQTFRIYSKINYTPNGEPLALRYFSTAGSAGPGLPIGTYWPQLTGPGQTPLWTGNNLGVGGFDYFFRTDIWSVSPAWDETMSDTLTGTNFTQNGPDLPGRGVAFALQETVTMPGFGEDIARDYDHSARPSLILYANDDVDAVSINGIPGTAYDGAAPSSRSQTLAGPFSTFRAYPKAFAWESDFLAVTTMQMSVTVLGVTIVGPTKVHGAVDRNNYREAVCFGNREPA